MMPLSALMTRLEHFPLSILQLALRIGVGTVFFRSGLLKIDSWEFTIRLFRDEYRVPLLDPVLAAQVATIVELGAPPLLFAGLATRLATLPLLGMIAVIQVFVYPNAWSDHLMWAAALVFVLTRGPGAFSVGYWIAKSVATRRR
jgi:putative oxidoreductase